jgi:transcriptional regulator with XRE-family HTH domain
MDTVIMKTSEWLEDLEIRAEYGSATFKYDIAAALVAARKMKNLTQAALANIAGVSQAYIAKLESGEANPTIGRIGAILASIWLKSEINLQPIVPIFHDEIPEQKQAADILTALASPRVTFAEKDWRKIQSVFSNLNVVYLSEQKSQVNIGVAIQETGLRKTGPALPIIRYAEPWPDIFFKGFNPTHPRVDIMNVPEQHALH